MKTKIVDSTETNFQPVTYQVTFNTREELAVFLAMTMENTKIAEIIAPGFSDYFNLPEITESKIRGIIDSLAKGSAYNELKQRLG